MSINVSAIKELRERTSAGMSDCKNALTEAEGDMEKAVEIILKKGLAKSAKRAGAAATEGEVRGTGTADKRDATIVEVNSQTDFSARNDTFKAFVGDVLELASKTEPGADINAQALNGKTVADIATELTAKIGEKISVRRWERVKLEDGKHGIVESYVHMGGKIGVILEVETSTADVAKHAEVVSFAENTAMQIAAMNPLVVRRDEIDEATVAKQKELYEAQLREDPKPKPEKAWPKIIEGKLNKWFSEVVLLEQESVVTSGKTIEALCKAAASAAGGDVTVVRFVRFERGEGITKKEDNFADEVAKMASKAN